VVVVRLIGSALLVAGCGSLLRTVPSGPHPDAGAEPVVVDYPPPPAEQELVTEDPGKPCAWQDGYWAWLGRRWSWEPGGWVVPPQGCYYARPVTVWVESEGKGALYFMQPRWYPEDYGERECEEPRPCGPKARSPRE
jgi:hypothetical protein